MQATTPRVPDAQTRFPTRVLLLLLIFFLLYWPISSAVLWWAYSIGASIQGGYYEKHQALGLVAKMGLLISVLTSFVWLFRLFRDKGSEVMRRGWTAAWQTALILILYTAVILAWPQFGDFSNPLPDRAFLPVLGTFNSHFFSEARPLSFLLRVTPIMACTSGLLYLLQNFLKRVFE